MRSVVLGSAVALVLLTGLFLSQVEAKNNNDDKGKNKEEQKFVAKNDKHDDKYFRFVGKNEKHEHKNGRVPIPGTELLLGGGFAGLIAWRARQRKPQA